MDMTPVSVVIVSVIVKVYVTPIFVHLQHHTLEQHKNFVLDINKANFVYTIQYMIIGHHVTL